MNHSIPKRQSWLKRVAWLLCGAAAVAASQAAEPAAVKEYQLKAAFIYNFTKFVEWPAESFTNAQAPIVIGVLAPNPFNGELIKAVEGRKVNGRDIVVLRSVESAQDAKRAHVIFVSSAAEKGAIAILGELKKKPVLTVGETDSFTGQGGFITFLQEADKLRFEVNQHEAEASGLKLSAQLLKLAKTVRKEPKP